MKAQVVQIRGKTEQRVTAVISVLKDAQDPLTYEELGARTGAAYDLLLHVLTTLSEVGLVDRIEVQDKKPGRPKVTFRWSAKGKARAMGAR